LSYDNIKKDKRMMQFKGFKPEAMQRIASTLGYKGNMNGFKDYLNKNPDKKNAMKKYQDTAVQMMNGGMVRKNYAAGGFTYSDDFDVATRRLGQGNTYGAMADGSQLIKTLTPDGAVFNILDPSGSSVTNTFSNFDDAIKFADPSTGTSSGSTSSRRSNDRQQIAPQQIQEQTQAAPYRPTPSPNAVPPPSGGAPFIGDGNGQLNMPQAEDRTTSQRATSTGRTSGDGSGSGTFTPTGIRSQPTVQDSTRELTFNKDVPSTSTATTIADISAERVTSPELPEGTTVDAVGVDLGPDQFIDSSAGSVVGDITTGVEQASANTAIAAPTTDANLIAPEDIAKVSGEELDSAIDKNKEAVGVVDPRAEVVAQTDNTTDVSRLKSASTEGILMDDPNKRVMTKEEEVNATASAEDAAKFTEKVQAATATPTEKATVKGQLAELMQDFEGGETPAWAAGAMRSVATAMASRGLSVSSIAGQALVQAAMESALPIASADASTFAKFESQNLSNRQERAMLAAEQRATFMGQEFDQTFQAKVMNAAKVSDIANLNFTAEQQVALENSRIANTVNLANLSNKQALIMAEAAALSQLETVSLNNRQQAEVKNSENLMAMDFANLSNEQAMNVFNAQTRTQALFSDVAAENAAEQFNATSQNQTDQFFASLTTQNSQFNVAQTNAINQFNAGETNAQSRFTSEMMNQREQFNANNKMAIEQSNVVWRRTVATADTESINRVNELNASAALGISNTAYNNMWQYFADTMENAYSATNSERDRMTKLAVAKLQVDAEFDIAKWQADAASSAAMGNAIVKIATTSFTGDTIFEKAYEWWKS